MADIYNGMKEAKKGIDQKMAIRYAERKLDLRDHLRFEKLISNLSAGFVNIAPERVDSEIERKEKELGPIMVTLRPSSDRML